MSPLLQSLLAAFLLSAVSFVGVVFVFREWSERLELVSLSFAAGVLLASVFLELLPQAAARAAEGDNLFVATLAAMVGFFLLERLLRTFHAPADSHAIVSRYLILLGDGLHNFVDGVVIAASFLVSPGLGVATTFAVAAHEVPQELADYGVLVSGRFSRRTALLLNFASGLTAMLGVLVCFAMESFVERNLGSFMAATAGMFLYVAASDLMPELQHARWRNSWLCSAPLLAGIAVMALLAAWIPDGG
jgi:zinc and cadmium transporter